MKQAIIFHGTQGSPEGNWFPWLKNYLEGNGWNVSTPTLPTPANQSLENWTEALKEQVPDFERANLIIGHSCGSSFALRLLEQNLVKPKRAIFVATVIDFLGNEFDALNKTFIDKPFEWETIAQACVNNIVFHGDNDPYVPLSHAEKISSELNAPLHIIKKGGHLNAEAGYLEFHEILDTLNET